MPNIHCLPAVVTGKDHNTWDKRGGSLTHMWSNSHERGQRFTQHALIVYSAWIRLKEEVEKPAFIVKCVRRANQGSFFGHRTQKIKQADTPTAKTKNSQHGDDWQQDIPKSIKSDAQSSTLIQVKCLDSPPPSIVLNSHLYKTTTGQFPGKSCL